MASGSGGSGFCVAATELVRELKRTQKFLPPYNENLVADVVAECNRSFTNFIKPHQETISALNDRLRREHAKQGLPPPGRDQLHTLADLPTSEQVTVAAHAAAIRRNKRCVLAYLLYRLAKLRGVWWAVGGVQLSEELRQLLSERERSTHHGYDALLSAYMAATDLTLAAELKPPKEPMIDVRATRDQGDVVTEKSGVLQLRTDVGQRMHRSDAEQLIRQGLLVQSQLQ